jgi:hypothetical protein
VTVFFGQRWDAPILDFARSAPTPVGVVCYLCDRPIHRGDQGFIRPLITENGPGGDLPVHRVATWPPRSATYSASAAALAGTTSTNVARSWYEGTTRGC